MQMAPKQILRAVADAEIRALLGEAVGHLRTASESGLTLTRKRLFDVIDAATQSIEQARRLTEQSNP
jgi:hypothetical protein